jgi:uncharacterized OB-fold protein
MPKTQPDIQQGVFPALLNDSYADESTKPFWDAALEGRLLSSRCTNCGTFVLPPTPYCFVCQHHEFEWVELPGTGTIYAFTVVRHALTPELANAVPYVSGVIELDGTQGAGTRMICNIVDCDPETVRIGDPVRVVFEKVSDTYAMPRFTPV